MVVQRNRELRESHECPRQSWRSGASVKRRSKARPGAWFNLQRACIALLALVAGSVPGDITFPDSPRVAHSADSLAAWKGDPARADEIRGILERADGFLANPPPVPSAGGQWYFFYLCPKDGTQLTAESEARHRCGTCGVLYEDERTVAAYRGIQWQKVDEAISALALAHALGTNAAHAAEAGRLLVATATLYPTLMRHDRWGYEGEEAPAGGRRYAQKLDEAMSAISLAKSYDLVASAFSEDDRIFIETNFFRQLAADFQADSTRAMWEVEYPKAEIWAGNGPVGRGIPAALSPHDLASWETNIVAVGTTRSTPAVHRSNHQTWINAALTAIGLTLADKALIHEAIDGPHGLRWQLEHSLTAEGIWYEVCMNYHFYAMGAVMETLQLADRVGLSFRDDAGLKSMWEGPVRFSYPDGGFPVINDSDVDRLQHHGGHYQWAADYFREPRFGAMADPTPEVRQALAAASSTNLAGAGLVYLRNGDPLYPICVVLDYGAHGGQHGHPDKLNITVYGGGAEVVADTGRIGYAFREYHAWARTTAANNTIVVNGVDQQATTGELISFVPTADGGRVVARCDTAYPGCTLQRTVEMEGHRLTDELAVTCAAPATLDCFLHLRGLVVTGLVDDVPGPPTHAEVKWQGTVEDNEFTLGGTGRLVIEGTASRYVGNAMGSRRDEQVPVLLRRVQGTQALFRTRYEFAGRMGSEKKKVAPRSTSDSAQTRPPWR